MFNTQNLKSNAFSFRFSLAYFSKEPSPFEATDPETHPKKKQQRDTHSDQISNLDIVECSLQFLKSDVTFYKSAWKWSRFIELYCNGSQFDTDHTYKLLCNNVLALLTNMTASQLQFLNKDIPIELIIDFENKNGSHAIDSIKSEHLNDAEDAISKDTISWDFSNDVLTNVEGVTLPVFDKNNYRFFANHQADGDFEEIVQVDSTRINLRSLALGVAAGKAVCLSGPVGSGKTTLVEYLARKTGRIAPKFLDIERVAALSKAATKENTSVNGNGNKAALKKSKRKRQDTENVEKDAALVNDLYKKAPTNGFLRIQLGDQTDSKMLLGQYRCTDVPGEFVWQAGVLTQVSSFFLILLVYC